MKRILRRVLWPLAFLVVLGGVLLVAVYPAQTYLRQKDELEAKRTELDELEAEGEQLNERAEALRDPAAVEALARQDYGLVRPGEEAYGIVPAEEPRVVLPDSWPFTELQVRFDRELD